MGLAQFQLRFQVAICLLVPHQIVPLEIGGFGIQDEIAFTTSWMKKRRCPSKTYQNIGCLEHFYFPIYWECHHPNMVTKVY